MALRTRSGSARAIVSAARIKSSETKRLQAAIKQLEKSVEEYNKKSRKRGKKKSYWRVLNKISSALTTLGSMTGNPVLAGVGLAVSSASGVAEHELGRKQKDLAKEIQTGYADPLSSLLFVGQEAKDIGKGASRYKESEEVRTKQQFEEDALKILGNLAVQGVSAGQAGTFGEGFEEFLNKPLLDIGAAPTGEGVTDMQKYLYSLRQQATPSVGQLLGGVSPQQQAMGEAGKKYFKEYFPRFDSKTKKRNINPFLLGATPESLLVK